MNNKTISMTLKEVQIQMWPIILERAKHHVKALLIANGKNHGCQLRVNHSGDDTSHANVCFIGALIKPEFYNERMEHMYLFRAFFDSNEPDDTRAFDGVVNSFPDIKKLSEDDYYALQRWLHNVRLVHDIIDMPLWSQELNQLDPGKEESCQ